MNKDYLTILSRILNSYVPVGTDAAKFILDSGSIEVYKRNEIIFYQRKFNAFEYFQFEGIAHRFNIDQEYETLTTGIYQNETVLTPHFARTSNGQSIFSVQALTDCTYLKVPAGSFRDLMDRHPQINAFGQAVVEREFTQNLNFEVLFRSYTAKDRLLFFRDNYPGLENTIQHSVIASFLGITPVSFSRLRSELAKNPPM